MKYSEYSKKSKFTGSTVFYILIACCLIAIGGISWYAVSTLSRDGKNPMDGSSADRQSSVRSELTESVQSDTMKPPSSSAPSAEAGRPVSDEPYTEPESSVSTPKTVVFCMPVEGEIIKGYNEQELQFSATYGDLRLHTGIDIACENGTSVSACSDGTVIACEESASLGQTVTLDLGNGLTVRYANLQNVTVQPNSTVSAGDILGVSATVPAECADQSHLHLEVYKNGHPADPLATFGFRP